MLNWTFFEGKTLKELWFPFDKRDESDLRSTKSFSVRVFQMCYYIIKL